MLFKEIIAAYCESDTKHKYRIQSYWLLKTGTYIYLPLDFEGLTEFRVEYVARTPVE
jgi:hypothetical protein